MNFHENYYLGLDIGTNSIGYSAIYRHYQLVKFRGEPVWGVHLFDEANQSVERRGFRTARRRLDRRQQRVLLTDEIFAKEVAKVDKNFYIRKKQSALHPEDKSDSSTLFNFFTSEEYNEKQYYTDYPTIHHLICALIDEKNKDKKFDIRLINIAIDWLMAHRGHFLNEIGTDSVMDFMSIYDDFMLYFDRSECERPWDTIDAEQLGEILKSKQGVNAKKAALKSLLYPNKVPERSDSYPLDRKELITFLAGGKVKCNKLFLNSNYEDDFSISINEDMETLLPQLGDDTEIIAKIAAMHDWSILSELLGDCDYISQAKVLIYEQHKKDLKQLKQFVKKYAPKEYDNIFRNTEEELCNYVAYSYNFNSVKKDSKLPKKKCDNKEFCDYLKKKLKLDSILCDCEQDRLFLEEMKVRIVNGTFMPKQVVSDNRVIPYQVYFAELKKILNFAKVHYPFLEEKDTEGYSNIDKLKSIFTFRVPYYVGPLRVDNGQYGWMKRKTNAIGKIYPWNFEKMVDLEASEEAFISKMTNMCTYIPGEDVLPKYSLLYTKYMVLNEINNLQSNGKSISVEAKQAIYNDLFCKRLKVTPKNIRELLLSNGWIQEEDVLTGLDVTIKSSLKPLWEFRKLLDHKLLTTDDVEEIIRRSTYSEDRTRFKFWLKNTYPTLPEEDLKYVSKLKYKEFGRLSKYFLTELQGMHKETGEIGSIMHFLWTTNDNLMQLLSGSYTFMEEIEHLRTDYYAEHTYNIQKQMDDLGLSNAVKRQVTRTLDVVKDVVSALGKPPEKIFVEMARGADEKKTRTVTRKDQILALYKTVEEDTIELERQLEAMGDSANNRLQSDSLFLYYLQLGKCMYTGESIDITQLKSRYNIEHIYPQSLVKDDSVLNNLVLVNSEANGEKKDTYPIKSEIREKMTFFWQTLLKNNLITKEKYTRLTRREKFSADEKWGFINRQLVETRQSVKAVTQLLKELYPQTEIVYVKARLAAEFRQEFLAPKSRLINDLHHAKDAYLNAVVGNVYHEKFSKKWFNLDEHYSIRTKTIFTHDLVYNDEYIWNCKRDLPLVKKIYDKNAIHLTRYAYCQKGGLFDQQPVKKGVDKIPLKKGLDTEKYGGYNKKAAGFFIIARYLKGKAKEVSFVPVDLMVKDKFLSDSIFATQYITEELQKNNTKKISDVEFPLGSRIIKIKTMLSLDGFRVWLNGKSSGGRQLWLSIAESLLLPEQYVRYVKYIENYTEKKKINRWLIHDEANDKLSEEQNQELYAILSDKIANSHFRKMPGNPYEVIINGHAQFAALTFDKQLSVLLNCISLLKSGRTGGIDLSDIGGKKTSGSLTLGVNLSSCKYQDIRIVDSSPAGLFESSAYSINLKELLP